MTVVGIHPEELVDKLLDGEITTSERERLRAHLDACEVCRFEYAARLDFQSEALELGAISAPPALPFRPLQTAEISAEPAPQSVIAGAPVPVRRRRVRLVVWGLAAAALITASAAVASGLTGQAPWHAFGLRFSQAATASEEQPVVAPKKVVFEPSVASAVSPPTKAPLAPARVEAPAALLPRSEAAVTTRRAPQHDVSARVAESTILAAVAASNGSLPSVKDGAVKALAVKEPSSAAKLFGEANQARRSGDIGRASGLYHLLQDQYPGSPEADLSRVTLSLLLLDSGDAQAALGGFERYLAGPSRGLEAEALVGRARALGRLGRRDLEASAWREVQRKYSRSIYGRQATERLSALGQP